jgi:hypothetical protein
MAAAHTAGLQVGIYHLVHTEWHLLLSGPAWRGWGLHGPPSFIVSTTTYEVVMYPPGAERADTHPLFLLYHYLYSIIMFFSVGGKKCLEGRKIVGGGK